MAIFSRYFVPKIHVWRAFPAHIAEALAVAKALRNFNLKHSKRVEFKFDPFHPKVSSIRDFIFHTSADKYRMTNGKCIFKTEICSDRSEPTIIITTLEDKKIVVKTANLSKVELLHVFNKHVSSLYKPEEVKELSTKASRIKRY